MYREISSPPPFTYPAIFNISKSIAASSRNTSSAPSVQNTFPPSFSNLPKMTKLIFGQITVFLVALGAAVVIVFNTSPNSADALIRVAFFAFSWLTLTSAISLIFCIVGRKNSRVQRATQLRRAALLAVAITGLLVFSALHVLNFISVLTFLLSIGLLEIFFMARRIEKKNDI